MLISVKMKMMSREIDVFSQHLFASVLMITGNDFLKEKSGFEISGVLIALSRSLSFLSRHLEIPGTKHLFFPKGFLTASQYNIVYEN